MRDLIAKYQTLLLLVAVQSVCLIAGLWSQHSFLEAYDAWIAAHPESSGDGAAQHLGLSVSLGRAALHVFGFLWILAPQVVASWLMIIRLRGTQVREQIRNQEDALRVAKELLMTRDAVVFGLAKLAESRDTDTGMHLERIALYSTRLAAAMRRLPRYRDVVNANFVSNIGISSALHDIGKVGVEDAILLKPTRLTHEEYFRIQTHTQLGGECIRQIERRLGGSNFLEMAREIALYHHERWDGSGYPVGLGGEEIPLAARIVAIADVYDALRVKRVYKEAQQHEECVRIIRDEAGKHFDPELVDVFLSIQHQFKEISDRFSDTSERMRKAMPPSSDRSRMTADEARILAGVTEFTGTSLSVVSAEVEAEQVQTA